MLLVTDKGEQIVSVAVPIQYRKAVQGVLLLSTRPGEIDEILAAERNSIIGLALVPFAATMLASFLLAATIAGPMRRLSEAAEHVGFNIQLAAPAARIHAAAPTRSARWPPSFHRHDGALYRRIEASERFAQDCRPRIEEPLTAARSTAEALAYAKTPAAQQELVRQIQEELKRPQQADHRRLQRVAARRRAGLRETEPGRPAQRAGLPCSRYSRTSQHRHAQGLGWRSPKCRATPKPSWCAGTRRGSAASSPICSTTPSRSRRRTAS
jgi:hypothetical protein